MYKGIDVSANNGKLDWDKIKTQIDFAIVRIGYGSDIASQDDKQAVRNLQECERLGIPYGVYLYSYALSTENAKSEAAHMKRMIAGHNPVLGVWFDMEDADGYKEKHGKAPHKNTKLMNDICVTFMNEVKDLGYVFGVYANKDYFTNILNIGTLQSVNGCQLWVAAWGPSACPINGAYMWQYTSDGVVDGNGISRMDMNYLYAELSGATNKPAETPTPATPSITIEEAAQGVIAGKYGNGNDRKAAIEALGLSYNSVQSRVNEILGASKPATPSITVEEAAQGVIAGKYGNGNDRKAAIEALGLSYDSVQSRVNEILEASKPAAPTYKNYVVKSGDSLWKIAANQLGNGSRYPEIKSLNGLSSDTIYAGQTLKLPN